MAKQITAELVFDRIPPRARDSHKGTYGFLTAVCGSSSFRGAAVLACAGALRSGAGIVCLASVEPVLQSLTANYSECILLRLPQTDTGGAAAEGSIPALTEKILRSTAVLVGCGMGNTPDTEAITEAVLRRAECPVILDADALNTISVRQDLPALLREAKGGVILTPHVGEMSRLCSLPIAQIKAEPARIAAHFAREWSSVVVLKDAVSVVASPDGEVYENTSGNAGLARGGSGDVLAGIISSLTAQGLRPIDAAVCGVYLHGAAADDCAVRLSMAGMLPSDLPQGLCNVFLAHGR